MSRIACEYCNQPTIGPADASSKAVTQALVEVHDRIQDKYDNAIADCESTLESGKGTQSYALRVGRADGLGSAAALVRAMMEGK